MVYIYVCKRFKVTMEMVSGKDGEWVNNLLQFYCKHSRINGKLERAEINPKKRTSVCSFDSSTDIYKINLVYKDSIKGSEHELKWVIKVTRSDLHPTADASLRHEKQVFARLMGDLINTVKQRAAGRLEGSRISFRDLLQTPEFIFEETTHHADQARNVLVLDNLEEKNYYALKPGPLNLCHMRMIVKTMAKFHAVSLTYKQMLFASFTNQRAQKAASRQIDEVVMEGDNRVLTGRQGLFNRFPFLGERQVTLQYLIDNRETFMDMFQMLLECFPQETHLVDIFEYIRISTEDILELGDKSVRDSPEYKDSPLDAITLGILEARSFLFRYEGDENKENNSGGKKNTKLQRSQSERTKDRGSFEAARLARQQSALATDGNGTTGTHAPPVGGNGGQPQTHPKSPKAMPANAKCPKLEKTSTASTATATAAAGKMRNKFLQNVIGKSKDDENVPLRRIPSKSQKERDPNQPPKSAALINAKYVTYGRITRDLSVLFWTSASTLIRRFYMIKMVECYVETLGITLGQLGIDTDSYGLKYQDVVCDFQQYVLYGFLISVLIAMAQTSPEELRELYESRQQMDLDEWPEETASTTSSSTVQQQQQSLDLNSKYLPLTNKRLEFLLDLMRDVGAYVESKDFEQGLPITNFERYHELWSMVEDGDEEEEAEEGDDGEGKEDDKQ